VAVAVAWGLIITGGGGVDGGAAEGAA